MPAFSRNGKEGGKQERAEEWRRVVQAEIDRLSALPLAELAAEVMVKGFGPRGPGADDDAITTGQANIGAGPTASSIAGQFVPPGGPALLLPTSDDYRFRDRVAKLVAEGLQELEHVSLVRFQLHTAMGSLDWTATRRGRAALERDEVRTILQAARGLG